MTKISDALDFNRKFSVQELTLAISSLDDSDYQDLIIRLENLTDVLDIKIKKDIFESILMIHSLMIIKNHMAYLLFDDMRDD